MKHIGDIKEINGAEIPIVDVITGGSPCQDLSVAGKRAGLDGERSGLFMEQIRIVKEQRNECIRQLSMRRATFDRRCILPRFMVWENVAGAFSSSGGADFHAVLEETVKIADQNAVVPRPTDKWAYAGCIVGDGWSVAWRVHDSQWWGVPQRRKRVALVADFNGHSAPDILFELHREADAGSADEVIGNLGTEPRPEVQPISESVCRNPEQGEQARQAAAGEITDGAGKTSSFTLKVRGGREFDRYGKRAGKGALVQEELSGTLGVTQDQTLITARNIQGEETSNTLVASMTTPVGSTQDRLVVFQESWDRSRDSKDPQCVTYGLDRASFNQGKNAQFDFSVEEELAQPLVARGPGGVLTKQ